VLTSSQELAKVIQEEAPEAIKAGEIKNQFGRKVAIVSMPTYLRGGKFSHTFRTRKVKK
jgi:hypothetical protein